MYFDRIIPVTLFCPHHPSPHGFLSSPYRAYSSTFMFLGVYVIQWVSIGLFTESRVRVCLQDDAYLPWDYIMEQIVVPSPPTNPQGGEGSHKPHLLHSWVLSCTDCVQPITGAVCWRVATVTPCLKSGFHTTPPCSGSSCSFWPFIGTAPQALEGMIRISHSKGIYSQYCGWLCSLSYLWLGRMVIV